MKCITLLKVFVFLVLVHLSCTHGLYYSSFFAASAFPLWLWWPLCLLSSFPALFSVRYYRSLFEFASSLWHFGFIFSSDTAVLAKDDTEVVAPEPKVPQTYDQHVPKIANTMETVSPASTTLDWASRSHDLNDLVEQSRLFKNLPSFGNRQ